MQTNNSYKRKGEQAARQHRKIQTSVARAEKRLGKSKEPTAMQAGARKYPEAPLPGKKLKKPGVESDLTLEPMYDAPYYQGSGKLRDMVAIITGGDSGIGRSVAILFAREGADVAIVYLNEHSDARKTKQLVEQEGRKCIIIPGDVTESEFCLYAVKQTIDEFEKLDVLVNNSAFQMHVPDIDHLSEEHFDLTLKTNLYGYFHMTRAALPYLRKGSSIINTGSVTGIRGSKNIPDYSLTKGGIHAWTRAIGGKLVSKGIRVNCVAPGPVWTPLNPADKKREQVEEFGADTPMKRAAQPEEIAPAYVFLASPQCSSYMTGEVIPIIGGY
ncbi:SDR family oxidoreductase [Chryseolinea sp. T2]|uniref:SDR family oxidoreductase n=1 Tax=Chryseolinea sp. T2 TaxID=3129255 RepID=UPI003076FDFF